MFLNLFNCMVNTHGFDYIQRNESISVDMSAINFQIWWLGLNKFFHFCSSLTCTEWKNERYLKSIIKLLHYHFFWHEFSVVLKLLTRSSSPSKTLAYNFRNHIRRLWHLWNNSKYLLIFMTLKDTLFCS